MQNFRFHSYTNILFGKGEIQQLPEVLDQFGKNVLLVYGGAICKERKIDVILAVGGGSRNSRYYVPCF